VVLPVLLSIGYGTAELLACGFGKPLGFTEKQVMGPFVEANGLKAGSDKSKPASEPTGVTKPAMVVEASEVPHCE
jgi:hypothetical protein